MEVESRGTAVSTTISVLNKQKMAPTDFSEMEFEKTQHTVALACS